MEETACVNTTVKSQSARAISWALQAHIEVKLLEEKKKNVMKYQCAGCL